MVRARLRVVVADDDREMRSWICAVLRPLEAEIVEAQTGWELLHLLAHDGPFDLVVSDLRMPAPDGLRVIAMARSAGLRTPFLVITAFPDDQLRRALTSVEDTWLMEKPVEGRDLVALATGILRGRPSGGWGV